MKWSGEQIKILVKQEGLTLTSLAESIGVTRKTVNGWIRGQVPKGNHLMALTKVLRISPESLFISENSNNLDISLPVHRSRGNARVTSSREKEAFSIALDYYRFFLNDQEIPLVPVLRGKEKTDENARIIAGTLRELSGVQDNSPTRRDHVFRLLKELGIKVIIRNYPDDLKAYAFYTKINGHRVVFVNSTTNVLDLNFALLHEAVHAVRDEVFTGHYYDKDEEDFCDLVANYIQFPDDYVHHVAKNISHLPVSYAVNSLKSYASENEHALHGIVKQLKKHYDKFKKFNVGGADTNLKKGYKTVGEVFFSATDAEEFISILETMSPLFVNSLVRQADTISYRRLGELLNLDSSLDAADLKNELLKLQRKEFK